jgi:hypothetical protein
MFSRDEGRIQKRNILYRVLFEKLHLVGLWTNGEVIIMWFDHFIKRKTEGLNKGPYNVMKLI